MTRCEALLIRTYPSGAVLSRQCRHRTSKYDGAHYLCGMHGSMAAAGRALAYVEG